MYSDEVYYDVNLKIPALKADPEATMETETAKKSLAIYENIGYLLLFTFHHIKISKSRILLFQVSI